MPRYIDADALVDEAMERYCKNCDRRKGIKNGKYRIVYEIGDAPCRACGTGDMIDELEDAPTIDAVPVVHCKDCIHRGVVNECPFAKYAVFKNDFYSTSVTYSYTMPDSPTRIEVLCPVPDDGYCYKGDRKDDE